MHFVEGRPHVLLLLLPVSSRSVPTLKGLAFSLLCAPYRSVRCRNRLPVPVVRDLMEPNPTTWMKEKLARRTGLEYMRVQNWFGNRRFLDKHGPRRYTPRKSRDHLLGGGNSMHEASEFSPGSTSCMSLVSVARAGPSFIIGSACADELLSLKRHQPPQTFMPAGTSLVQPRVEPALQLPSSVMQPHVWAMYQKLQQAVTHAEDKLGHPSRAYEPTSTKFRPLTSGTFGVPLDVTVPDVHMHDTKAPRTVREYEFFPMAPSWLLNDENVNHTRPVSSINISSHGGQTSNKHACAISSFSFQYEASDATHQSQQGGVKTASSLAEYHKAPNCVLPNCAPDDRYAVSPVTQLGNLFYLSDKVNLHYDSYRRMEKAQVPNFIHSSESSGDNEFHPFDNAKISTPAAFEDTDNRDGNWTMQNQRRYQSCRLHHARSYDCFHVMPQGRSVTASVDVARQAYYFSDTDDSCRLLVAKWNHKENRAVYIIDDSDNTVSMSSGTESTLSYGYDDEATANVKGHAGGKSMEETDVNDEEDHAGEAHSRRKNFNVAGIGEDYDEMEDMYCKDGENNEYKRDSPLSSEHTL
ncbi:hypothetical protein BHE74_00050329 [Ensete ventricosum]|nr:hypothetical protein GW17_00039371 [Ensete ventricosum]RWW43953.1 hypothetical protein BHE74_00050329 [Ensete ventricosum]RZR95847.1 hypothetical protein BHM03_00024739 [Ensete ventricosum]